MRVRARSGAHTSLAAKALGCLGLATVVWLLAIPVGALVVAPRIGPSQEEAVNPSAVWAAHLTILVASVLAGLLGAAAAALGVASLAQERRTVRAVIAIIPGALYLGAALTVIVPGL